MPALEVEGQPEIGFMAAGTDHMQLTLNKLSTRNEDDSPSRGGYQRNPLLHAKTLTRNHMTTSSQEHPRRTIIIAVELNRTMAGWVDSVEGAAQPAISYQRNLGHITLFTNISVA
jgi:hypothetical protein